MAEGRAAFLRPEAAGATSNAMCTGGALAGPDLNSDTEKARTMMMQALRQQFRPEFLNRIDDIISFNSLGEEHLKEIVDIQLGHVRKRLAEKRLSLNQN